MNQDSEIFVKFLSHRARDYGLSAIGEPKPQSYYLSFSSPRANLKHRGIYKLTKKQLEALRSDGRSHAKFTVMKKADDLLPTIDWF